MPEIKLWNMVLPVWIILPVTFLAWVMILFFFKKALFGAVRRFAQKTQTQIDDIFIRAADFPLTLLIFTGAAAVVERTVPLVANGELTTHFLPVFKAVTILAIVLFVDRFLSNLIHEYSKRIEILRSSGSIVRGFARIVVIGLGVLILLDSFGVSITPVIASLGIGSLAVALALQPTLENLFCGIQIVMDKPIQLGHFIRLESGEEGYVHKIGWRSTWIRMLPNNMVVMPNKALVNSRLINYYYPEKELAVLVEAGVHYKSDLDRVERVTIDVAREVQREVSGAVKDFQPLLRYHTFGEFSVNFTVVLRAEEFTDGPLMKHEFIKRLLRRYAKESIVIPYPVQAVNYDQETEGSAKQKAFEKERD